MEVLSVVGRSNSGWGGLVYAHEPNCNATCDGPAVDDKCSCKLGLMHTSYCDIQGGYDYCTCDAYERDCKRISDEMRNALIAQGHDPACKRVDLPLRNDIKCTCGRLQTMFIHTSACKYHVDRCNCKLSAEHAQNCLVQVGGMCTQGCLERLIKQPTPEHTPYCYTHIGGDCNNNCLDEMKQHHERCIKHSFPNQPCNCAIVRQMHGDDWGKHGTIEFGPQILPMPGGKSVATPTVDWNNVHQDEEVMAQHKPAPPRDYEHQTLKEAVVEAFKVDPSHAARTKPGQAGIADRNVPGADHSCTGVCTPQSCEVWRNHALEIGRITEVAPGEYQSEIDFDWTQFDVDVMRAVAGILGNGAKVYGQDAWRRKSPRHHINHAIDHLFTHLNEGSSKENHLGNAICRVMFAYGVYKITGDNNTPDPEKHGRNKGS